MKKIPHCKNCDQDGHYKLNCHNYSKISVKPFEKPIKHATLQGFGKGLDGMTVNVVYNNYKPIKKVTKPKKPSRSKIKKDLDKLVKDYVKERDNYTDQRTGEKVTGSNCHASHVFPVGSCSVLQFEPLNIIVLSYHNHINWWHKNPIEASEWFKGKFPERLLQLEELRVTKSKTSTYGLQVLVDEYKAKLKDL